MHEPSSIKFLKNNTLLTVLISCITGVSPSRAQLVGQWTFEGSNPLADSARYFPDLALKGTASVTNGQLDLNGSGTSATGWAVTTGSYTGPAIISKTLVSWLRLQALSPNAYAGSAITLDQQTNDVFDGIVFAERQANRWMAGSSGFARTQDFSPGFQETTTGSLLQLAITYQVTSTTTTVRGYRNGVEIGAYTANSVAQWNTGNAEIFFGVRHGTTTSGLGALDALIEEARVYNTTLSQAQIQSLQPVSTQVPAPLPLLGTSAAFAFTRRLKLLSQRIKHLHNREPNRPH